MVMIIISKNTAEDWEQVTAEAIYIIIRRIANGNENDPRKKKFVTSLQTCNKYKQTLIKKIEWRMKK